MLIGRGFVLVLINPLRTRRFAEEDLLRAKTDAIDARSIARFLSEKRPEPSRLPEDVTEELREMVRLRDRFTQDLGDRKRQLHRALDLGEDIDLLRERLAVIACMRRLLGLVFAVMKRRTPFVPVLPNPA